MTTVVATVSKKKKFHWDKVSKAQFIQGLVQHGRNWVQIARLIPTVNSSQVKWYSERFFKKLKESAPAAEKQLEIVLVAHAATIKATKVATEVGIGVTKLAALEADEAAAEAAVKAILKTATATVALKEKGLREGGWDNEEHDEFLRLIDVHGNQWTTIAAHMVVGNRTGAQVYSHAQSHFNQTKKNDTQNCTTNYTHLKARLAAGKAAAAAAKKASKDEEDDTSSRPLDASDGGTVAVTIATAKNNNQNKPAPKAAKVASASSSSSNNNDNNTTQKKASLPPRQQLKHQKNTIWKKIKKGSRVAILWPDDKLYYACTVEEQHNGWENNNSSSRFFVRYDCNGTEWTDMAMEKLRWCEDDEHFDEDDDDDDDDEEEQEATGTSSSATSSASAASSGDAAVLTSNRSLPPRSASNGREGAVSIEHIQAKQRRRQRVIYTMETKILKEPYRGWVKNYKDPYYQVEYENGDVEDLSHSEVTKYLSNYEVNIADIQTSAGGKTKQEWEREQRTQKRRRKRNSSDDNADVLRKQKPQQEAKEETSAVEEAKDAANDGNTDTGNDDDNVDAIATSQVGSTYKATTSATHSTPLPLQAGTSTIHTTSLATTDFAALEASEIAAAAQMITTNHFLLLQEYTQYQSTAIHEQKNLEQKNLALKRKADDYDRLESKLKRMKVDAKEKEEEVSILLGKHLDTFTSLYDTINKLKADDETQKETIADLLFRLQSEN